MIKIRHAVLDDLPILLEFEQDLINTERPMDTDLRLDHIQYYDLEALIQSPNAAMLVAEVDQQIVGCGYAKIRASKAWHNHDRHCYLGFMYTLPQFRGKCINEKVMDALFQWSRSKGIHNVSLEVYENNPPAIKAYEKVGFDSRLIEMRLRLDE